MRVYVSPTTFLAHVCAIAIVMVFGVAIGLAAPCLPKIEGYFRPIIIASAVDGSFSRDDQKACFSLDVRKLHVGDPLIYQFAVEVRQNQHWLSPISVNAHIVDEATGRSRDDYDNHKVGSSWRRHWCFDLPGSVSPWQVVRVSGYAAHRAHPLWNTHSPTPSFVIPGA